ncbi:MAG: diacylglycerol kinase family lipid kinase [Candidatus Riflebacteria bacterium]|nr:diacylglycerol kinase family lipid kinase [Candidatus Riflebacteria bacterium]
MKTALLYNRRSGKGSNPDVEDAILDGLESMGHEVELMVPTAKGQMTELARQAVAGGYELLIAAGGDGTLNEVVNGCLGKPVLFGVIPLGTVNVWARCVGIPIDVSGALKVVRDGHTREVTLGRANDRAFMFAAGIGIDGEVISHEDLHLKKYLGRFSYYWQTVRTLCTYDPPRLELSIEGEPPIPCRTVVFGKAPLYGDRFYLTPRANPFDDVVDVCIFRWYDAIRFLKTMYKSSRNGAHLGESYVEYRRVARATVTSPDKAHVQVDGEYLGVAPLTVEALPRALKAILPPG